MTDPKRLLDDTGLLTPEERRVLAADARFNAPPHARAQLWSPIAAAIGTATMGPSLSSAASAGMGAKVAASSASVGHALGFGAVVKLTVLGVGIGTSIATVNHFWPASATTQTQHVAAATHEGVSRSAAASSTRAATTPSNTTTNEPGPSRASDNAIAAASATRANSETLDEAAAAHPSSDDAQADAPGANGHAPSARHASVIDSSANTREESQLVGSARSMLRAGNAVVALQLLDRAATRFPNGVLIQEREALRIEALSALGRTSEARRLADAFVKAYPGSPHVSRVQGPTRVQP